MKQLIIFSSLILSVVLICEWRTIYLHPHHKKTSPHHFSKNLIFFILIGLVGCDSPNPTPIAPLLPTNPPVGELPALDPAEIELGESVYAVHCASCHGADLEGQLDWKNPNEDGSFRSPPHDETGHTWHHSDAILLEAIGKGGTRLGRTMAGKSNMPAYSQILTDEEISAVLTFIKSSWSADIQQVQWEQNQR